MAVIAAKPQAEKGRDRPPPGAPPTTPNPRPQLHNSSSVRTTIVPGWVMTGEFFSIFYPYKKSLTLNSDGAEADQTIASRAIDSRVLRTWEDRVGMPGATHAIRALPVQLTSSMFPFVDLM